MISDPIMNIQLTTTELYEMYNAVMDDLEAEWCDDSCVTYRNIVRILCYSAMNHVNITNAALSLGLVEPYFDIDDVE